MGKASRKKATQRRVAQARTARGRSPWLARGALALVVVVGIVLVVASAGGRDGGDVAVPEGTEVVDIDERSHVDGDVDYDRAPPIGGAHAPAWQNCGVYEEPVRDENAVHSLEHGAVWITYRPDLPAEAVETLEDKAEGETHVLVTPYEDLDAPVVLSAWGRQLAVDSAEDGRIDEFLRAFQQGPQTPELGAVCSGAVGDPR